MELQQGMAHTENIGTEMMNSLLKQRGEIPVLLTGLVSILTVEGKKIKRPGIEPAVLTDPFVVPFLLFGTCFPFVISCFVTPKPGKTRAFAKLVHFAIIGLTSALLYGLLAHEFGPLGGSGEFSTMCDPAAVEDATDRYKLSTSETIRPLLMAYMSLQMFKAVETATVVLANGELTFVQISVAFMMNVPLAWANLVHGCNPAAYYFTLCGCAFDLLQPIGALLTQYTPTKFAARDNVLMELIGMARMVGLFVLGVKLLYEQCVMPRWVAIGHLMPALSFTPLCLFNILSCFLRSRTEAKEVGPTSAKAKKL